MWCAGDEGGVWRGEQWIELVQWMEFEAAGVLAPRFSCSSSKGAHVGARDALPTVNNSAAAPHEAERGGSKIHLRTIGMECL